MSKTVIKEEIVSGICYDTMYNRAIATAIVNSLLENITRELSRGNRVQFAGFGTFSMKERAPRTGRNPTTGEAVPIPAREIPVFEPGDSLKRETMRGK